MVFTTLKAAKAELAKRNRLSYKHEIVKFEVHKPLCLHSNGSIIPPYPCTCGGTGEYRYTLKLLT